MIIFLKIQLQFISDPKTCITITIEIQHFC